MRYIVSAVFLLFLCNPALAQTRDWTKFYGSSQLETIERHFENNKLARETVNKPFGSRGDTPLSAAARLNSAEVVSYLLSIGADPAFRRDDGLTVLMIAARDTNDPEVINILARALGQTGINTQDDDGRTALMHAARYSKNQEVILNFVKNNADPFLKDKKGATALDYLTNSRPGGYFSPNDAVVKNLKRYSDPARTSFKVNYAERSEVSQIESEQPEAGQTASAQPVAKKDARDQPADQQTGKGQSAGQQIGSDQSVGQQSGSEQSTVQQAGGDQSAGQQIVSEQSAGKRAGGSQPPEVENKKSLVPLLIMAFLFISSCFISLAALFLSYKKKKAGAGQNDESLPVSKLNYFLIGAFSLSLLGLLVIVLILIQSIEPTAVTTGLPLTSALLTSLGLVFKGVRQVLPNLFERLTKGNL